MRFFLLFNLHKKKILILNFIFNFFSSSDIRNRSRKSVKQKIKNCGLTDATDTAFAGLNGNKWFQAYFPLQLLQTAALEKNLSLTYSYGLCFIGKGWKTKRLLFHSDNLATV